MKKLFIAIAALSLLCAPAQAQGFLNKLKEKAEKAVGGNIGNPFGVSSEEEQPLSAMPDSDAPAAVTGEQALPAKRASTFGWDGPVTPSSAKFPIPLMNEFPAVPSASELAHPTEEAQIAYYKAIKAVTLRAEELNEDTTCEDEQTLMYREKSNKMLSDLFGLPSGSSAEAPGGKDAEGFAGRFECGRPGETGRAVSGYVGTRDDGHDCQPECIGPGCRL